MSTSPALEEPPTSVVLRRRLLGLLVLLLFLFLLSVLLRALGQPRQVQEDGLQTVVVPLGGSELPPVVAAPEPETVADEPEPQVTEDAPAPAPAAVSVLEPQNAEPRPSSPIQAAASPPAPASKPVKPSTKPVARPASKETAAEPAPKAPAAVGARWYVVLGTFSDAANAKALSLRARQSGFRAEVVSMKSGGGPLNRVRAGPFRTESEGQSAMARLIIDGISGAKLVKEP